MCVLVQQAAANASTILVVVVVVDVAVSRPEINYNDLSRKRSM